jgi:hypothetical protein
MMRLKLAAALTIATILAVPAIQARAEEAFACLDQAGGRTAVAATLLAVRTEHHPGYDQIAFAFQPGTGIPAYRVLRQSSATFNLDPSGQAAALEGKAGASIVFQQTALGSSVTRAARPELPLLREVRTLGEFERVATFGIGLSEAACIRVTEMQSAAVLTIDFATRTSAPTPAPHASPGSPAHAQDKPGGVWLLAPLVAVAGLAGAGTAGLLWRRRRGR